MMETLDSRETVVVKVHQDFLEVKVSKDKKENQDYKALSEEDPKVSQDTQETKDCLDPGVAQVKLALQEWMVFL